MIVTSKEHDFFYAQICVYCAELSAPYNDWSQAEADQGFAYREESVSFLTTFEAGRCLVNVGVFDFDVAVSVDACRVIEVPFLVPATRGIEVASVIDGLGDAVVAAVPKGTYSLRYEAFAERGEEEFVELQLINLHFLKVAAPKFAILRADSRIVVPPSFTTDGRPA